ncbi:MAG: o-succinylbenzoate synthase [Myxococcaceae bacterium]|nr:o-succinylbenzoate synthase [Myxococcaceae bacterium]
MTTLASPRMKLELRRRSLSLARPLVTAHGALERREGFEVVVSADGRVGRGEAFPLEAFGTESLAAAEAALRSLALDLVDSVEAIAEQLAPLASAPTARFAAECALLEWLAVRRAVPVAALFGAVRPVVPVNALIEGRDAEALAGAARLAVSQGFKTLKLKVGARSVAVDAQRLVAVRQAVGPAVALRIDANGGWSEGVARSTLRGLDSLGLELCEQPVSPVDVEGLRRVSAAVPVPVAADEVLSDRSRWARVLDADPRPAAQVLVLKPAVLGGLVPALELARAASERGVSAYVTTLMDGPLARAAATHLAAVLPPSPYAHGLSTVELFTDLAPDAFTPRSGAIELPASPGWGV